MTKNAQRSATSAEPFATVLRKVRGPPTGVSPISSTTMSIIPLTLTISLCLVFTFLLFFLRENARRFSSAERESLLPLADETPRVARSSSERATKLNDRSAR